MTSGFHLGFEAFLETKWVSWNEVDAPTPTLGETFKFVAFDVLAQLGHASS